MSNEVTTAKQTGLGALSALKTGLSNVRAAIPDMGGKALLRMMQEKDGWVFGQENNHLPLGTEIVFNTLAIRHGYVCWTSRKGKEKNELLEERFYSISQQTPLLHEMPAMQDPKTGEPCGWSKAYVLEGKILSGKFKGTEIQYKTNSMGGEQAVSRVIDAILARVDAAEGTDSAAFVLPICELQQKEPYANKSGGRTYPPDFPVVGWMDLEGNEEGDDVVEGPASVKRVEKTPEPEPEPEPETTADEAPRRRRRTA